METEGYGSCLILFRADLNWGRNDGGDTLNKMDVYKIETWKNWRKTSKYFKHSFGFCNAYINKVVFRCMQSFWNSFFFVMFFTSVLRWFYLASYIDFPYIDLRPQPLPPVIFFMKIKNKKGVFYSAVFYVHFILYYVQ